MRSPICAVALAAAMLTLAGCVTGGMDEETKAALRTTMESVQELTELWQERLDALDGEGEQQPPVVAGGGSVDLIGSASLTEYTDLLDGTKSYGWDLDGWGVKGTDEDGSALFTATIHGASILASPTNPDPFFDLIFGLRSFDNPVGYGTATWAGKVRAYETAPATLGAPVEGDAELTMDLDSTLETIDVDFTGFNRGHASMSWNGLFVNLGQFSRGSEYVSSLPFIKGRFYGDGHDGVAGTFDRDGLKGVFGAVRD